MNTFLARVLRRPVSIMVFYAAATFFSLISFFGMKQEFTPPIDIPSLLVISSYSAASPTNVRSLLTKPLENALSGIQGLKSMQSLSRNALSLIELKFQWGTDMLTAGIQVREVIDARYPSLPEQASKPIVLKTDPNQQPVMILGLYPETKLSELRQLTDRSLRSALQQTPGVGTVILKGGQKQEVKVELPPLRLSSVGLTIDQLGQLLRQSNFEYPAGSFREGRLEYLLKSSARAKDLNELGQLPLRVSPNFANSGYLRLKDLSSEIYLGNARQLSYFGNGQREGIALIIRRQASANIVRLNRELRKKIARLEQKYEGIFRLEILYDASQEVRDSLGSLSRNLALGIAMVFVVVLLLVGNWRMAMILILAIPLSLLITVLLMYLSGLSLNRISLAALTLSVGLLVDNSVVVLEGLEKRRCCRGIEQMIAVVQSSAMPVLGATATSILIFLPLLFLPNVIGAIYRDLSLTLSYALLSSFFVSMTIAPLSYHLLEAHFPSGSPRGSPSALILRLNLFPVLERSYRKILKNVFRHYKICLFWAVVPLFSTVPLLIVLPRKIVNESPGREVVLQIEASPNTSIQRMKELARAVHEQIQSIRVPLEQYANSPIAHIYIESGGEANDSYYYANPENTREKAWLHLVFADLINGQKVADAITASVDLREVRISAYPPSGPMMQLLGIQDKAVYRLSSLKDDAELRKKIAPVMSEEKVDISPQGEQWEVAASPKREYLEQSGISASQLQSILQSFLEGKVVSEIELDGELYPIRLEIPGRKARSNYARIQSLHDLRSMVIPVQSPGQDGKPGELRQLRLGQLTRLGLYERSAALQRVNQKDSLSIGLEREGKWQKILQAFPAELRESLSIRSISASVFAENAQKIVLILFVSLLLLYFFLGMQFSSFGEPLLLLLNIPFSLWGSSMFLWLTGQSLTISSFMGILILFGLCANNAIVLREELRRQIGDKAPKPHQVYMVWVRRLRAISITTLSTILALLPSALNPDSSGQQNLALTIIGGMLSSSFFTLCILPLASLLGQGRRRKGRKRDKG